MCTDARSPERRQRGISFIELIMFIVIVGAGLAGVLTSLNVNVFRSADPMVSKQMLAVAESMMEEVQAKDFDASVASRSGAACFAGAAIQANRAEFDCVSNYNGFATTGIVDSTGTPIAALASYNVAVAVAAAGSALAGVPAGAIWVITVTVTRGTETLTLTGYRFNYG